MSPKTYTLEPSEKATQVMVGTADLLIWGDLVTKEHARIVGFLATLAEDFVPLRDAKILFLSLTQKSAPVGRPTVYVKLEEILIFHSITESEPLPEESEVRRFEPLEATVGSFLIEGIILKSPIATLQNLLLVSKDEYMPIYRATICHVAKPWLGTFKAQMVQVRRDRMSVMTR
jgi:hypothetical protein